MRFYTEYTSTFSRGILCLFKCNKCNIYDISNIKRFPSLQEFYYWGLLKKMTTCIIFGNLYYFYSFSSIYIHQHIVFHLPIMVELSCLS